MAHGPDTEELLRRMANNTEELNVSGLNITSLPELPSRLQYLNCHRTHLTSLPELPSGLIILNCSNTRLTSLPKFPSELIHITCSHTPITSISELPFRIQSLDCSYTQLTILPELPSTLLELFSSNTPLILERKDFESIADYNRRWKAWREEQESRARIQTKARLLKEEIVMEAWHPRKVEQWVDCGVDLACL